MKKLNLLLLVAFMVSSFGFLASCTDEGNENTPKPVLTMLKPTAVEASYAPGTLIEFKVTVNTTAADMDIESFTVSATVPGATGTTSGTGYSPSGMEGSFDYDYVVPSGQDGEEVVITFEAAHKDGSASLEAKFTVAASTALSDEHTDEKLYNINGSKKGAFDLVNNVNLSSSDASANKDMVNTTPTVTVDMVDGFYSLNNTMFVTANTLDYATVTLEQAVAAYEAGTPTAGTNNPDSDFDVAEGDLVVAKLRGADNYAVLHIVSIVEASNNDDDEIVFSYKKAPAGASKSSDVRLVFY